MTSILPGVTGANLEMAKDLDALVPQPFVAATAIVPPVKLAGYINEIVLLP
jgi:hypothetical protein